MVNIEKICHVEKCGDIFPHEKCKDKVSACIMKFSRAPLPWLTQRLWFAWTNSVLWNLFTNIFKDSGSVRFLKNRREAQNLSWNSFIKLFWYVVLVHFMREQNYWYQTSSDCFVFRKCFGRGWRESEFTSLTRSSIFIYLWGNKNERRGAVQNNQTPMFSKHCKFPFNKSPKASELTEMRCIPFNWSI